MANLRVPQIAERTGLKESTVRRWIFEKRLPVVRIGRTVAVPEEFIEKIIRENFEPALNAK